MTRSSDQQGMTRMVLALVGICVAGALVLATVEHITRQPIAEQKRQEMVRSLAAVLPPHTNRPDEDFREVTTAAGETYTLYLARQREEWVGSALKVTAPDGYAGNIEVMVGVNRAGEITGVSILSHAETPGLGDKMVTDPDWLPAFRGRTLDNTRWGVRKDGGEIDQFTGATITPRAVVGAVRRALEVCAEFCR